MEWGTILTNAVITLAPIGAAFAWLWGRLDRKFEAMESCLKEIQKDIRSIDSRLSHLEGQDEEKFRNEIRLIAKGGSQNGV